MNTFDYNGSYPWFNTAVYSVPQLILFGLAAVCWVIVYIIVIKDIIKNKFVSIPVLAICANISWEFLWSFRFHTNMGELFQWGYRTWFVLDVYIFYAMFKYAKNQFSDIFLHKRFALIVGFTVVSWVAGIYMLTIQVYDPVGALSAYFVNTHMSALYILLILQFPKEKSLSVLTAWLKMLGTGLTSVFCFWVFPDQYLMLTLSVITFLLDCSYIAMVTKIRASEK